MQTTSPPPILLPNAGQIHEANINNAGRDYFDHRQMNINHFNFDAERDTVVEVDSRRFLDDLKKQSSLGAVSYAEERTYAPRCLHETRAKVLNDLGRWSSGEGPWKDVKLLVLTGPAGHGKSAIMQSFSEQLLEKSKGTHLVIATFFFKATLPDQNQPKALVTTLTHQVTEHCSSMRRQIVSVIRDNVGIFSTSLENQMKHLLVNPITSSYAATPTGSSLTLICAVDGLDECEGDDAQSRVIRLLHTLSTTPNTRVVLASRPEFPIESAIKRGLSGMLHIDLNKDYNAGEDIRQFTWMKLLEIRDRLLPGIDRTSWPRDGDAEQIAEYASGQFILADTAMRYVDDRRYDPRERLEEVLALCGGASDSDPDAARLRAASPESTRPFGTLDTLFTGILEKAARNAYPDLKVKHGILELASLVWILIETIPSKKSNAPCDHPTSKPIPLWVIEEALGLRSGGLARELSDLHSLLDVPQGMYGCDDIVAHHKSFPDFLGDPRRSGHLGDAPQRAKSRFNEMITSSLRRMTENDLIKGLIVTRNTKPHILHYLHLLCKPEVVMGSVGLGVWEALLPSLNTWETLCLRDWVLTGLREGPLYCTVKSITEAARDESWANTIPGISMEGIPKPHSISEADLEELRIRANGQEGQMFKGEPFAYIPTTRSASSVTGCATLGFPWYPLARVLASLWAPKHRLAANRGVVRPIDSQFIGTSALRTQGEPQLVFIVGARGSGKRELLREAHRLLPVGGTGTVPDWASPPVDIIIVPEMNGLSLKSLWTPGSVDATAHEATSDIPCNNKELMGNINLSHQIPASLFQDWATCWKDKDERNSHHPQFLLQGLHLLSPEHQGILLDIIPLEGGLSQSTGRLPFFVTVTSLPTLTLAHKLQQFSGPGVYYVNLDIMKADAAVIEGFFASWTDRKLPLSPLKLSKLAQILAGSPRPSLHIKKLLRLRHSSDAQWENRLDPILAASGPEAWRLIEEHLGDIVTDDESGQPDARPWWGESK